MKITVLKYQYHKLFHQMPMDDQVHVY